MTSPLAIVLLAAGKGTRMKSDLPKVLHPVAWRPMIDHLLETTAALSAARRLVVVGHGADGVRTACAAHAGIAFVDQGDPRGTGHAVQVCRDALAGFRGTVLILPGDAPLVRADSLRALLDRHAAANGPLTVLTTRPPDPTGYGRIVRSPGGGDRVERIVEHRDAGEAERAIGEINTGILAADATFLFEALAEIRPANAQKELYLTDVVARAAARGTCAAAALREPAWEFEGINDRAQLAQAEVALFRRVAAHWMAEGRTILDPASTRIDPRARLGADTTIHPRVEIRGACAIGDRATIETGSVLEEVVLGSGVHVKPYCVLTRARAARGAIVGPFAHLRPEADLGEEVHVGNFVEVKKSTLGKGSKANHLAYLGDATIGSGVNVGAGTITCNYDGYAKHRTTIEDGVFIGSDTQLVAPVRIGKGAVLGAGSTITKDVAAGALALTRAKQVEIPGYAERARKAKSKSAQPSAKAKKKSSAGGG